MVSTVTRWLGTYMGSLGTNTVDRLFSKWPGHRPRTGVASSIPEGRCANVKNLQRFLSYSSSLRFLAVSQDASGGGQRAVGVDGVIMAASR